MIKKHYGEDTTVLWDNHALRGLIKLPFMCSRDVEGLLGFSRMIVAIVFTGDLE